MDGGGHDEVVLDGAGSRPGTREPRTARHALQWVSWIFGFAVLAAVIIAVLHFSEERELVRITENAQPWWLAIAILLQVGTYLAQGETWRVVTRAGKFSVPLSAAFKLSLAKLFIDQALPSAGISGTVVVARALEERGVSRAVVMAAVVVDSVSYYAAYVLTLALALLITVLGGHASPLTVAAALAGAPWSGRPEARTQPASDLQERIVPARDRLARRSHGLGPHPVARNGSVPYRCVRELHDFDPTADHRYRPGRAGHVRGCVRRHPEACRGSGRRSARGDATVPRAQLLVSDGARPRLFARGTEGNMTAEARSSANAAKGCHCQSPKRRSGWPYMLQRITSAFDRLPRRIQCGSHIS